MKKEPNKKAIGLFMLLGLALFGALIAKNLAEKYMMSKRHLVVLYFSESISGLNIGSPVVYEGVQVGKVVKIEIHTNPKTLEFSIPVYIRFLQDNDFSHMTFEGNSNRRDFLQMLIDKGLRARLDTLNLLTGQLMIDLFMDPNSEPVYHDANHDEKYLEIPTTLSAFSNLARGIEDLPLKQIIWRFDNVLARLETDLPPLMAAYTNVGEKLGDYLNKSLPQTNQSLNQLNQTLKDVSNASKSIKNLSDYLERHPDSILKGKKE
ncbi:MAG: MCE family protein [Alphaproteobacteria bacterium]|nr:MCE family protein [Alphaproteobacteria bacterium]MBQ7659516.1 MCE family protein [Alphaproteobacteria bacterium]